MTQDEKISKLLDIIDILMAAMSQNNDVMKNHYLQQAIKLRATIQ